MHSQSAEEEAYTQWAEPLFPAPSPRGGECFRDPSRNQISLPACLDSSQLTFFFLLLFSFILHPYWFPFPHLLQTPPPPLCPFHPLLLCFYLENGRPPMGGHKAWLPAHFLCCLRISSERWGLSNQRNKGKVDPLREGVAIYLRRLCSGRNVDPTDRLAMQVSVFKPITSLRRAWVKTTGWETQMLPRVSFALVTNKLCISLWLD